VARQADDATALIVRVRLPQPLEQLRQQHVPGATQGLPAHCTLLYPFLRPEALTAAELRALRARVLGHPAHDVRLVGQGSWPDALYAAVEPDAPLRALQADLAALFPWLPLYGGAHPFVPHVTVVAGTGAGLPALAGHKAWSSLPSSVRVSAIELIAEERGRWQRRRRMRLGPAAGS
jgi:2'-5' RNA ligase